MKESIDVLIPTFNRPLALGMTLTCLANQEFQNFNVIISDQSRPEPVFEKDELISIIHFLEFKGHAVRLFRNLPYQGMAQQRQFLLDQSSAKFVLFLDDDLILENFVLGNLMKIMKEEKCGFVGTGTIGLNYINDQRPQEEKIEFIEDHVSPETILPSSAEWHRELLHRAANLLHVERKLHMHPENPRKYKLAWASACVLFDRMKLIKCGGFHFQGIPQDHCGEDVAAQLRVIHKYGGCGVIPSGVYHQELRTTLPNRKFNIPEEIQLFS